MESLTKLIKYLFSPRWTQWKVVGYTESLGYHVIIQVRMSTRTGYVQVSKKKLFVNGMYTDFKSIQEKMLNLEIEDEQDTKV